MKTKQKNKEVFSLGEYLKELREKKGVSLRDVESATNIPNVYLSQIETGERKKLPPPERLKKLANYYNVSVHQLLQKAGYIEPDGIEETLEQKIEKAFLHVVNDPEFKFGTRLNKKYDLDTKRFIVEMYEKLRKNK